MRSIMLPRAALIVAGAMSLAMPAVVLGPAAASDPVTASPNAAPAAPATFTVQAIEIPVKIGPGRDQKCTIVADLYRPAGATRRNPAPSILTTNGFGGDKADANQTGIGHGFAQEGYVVLSYSGLGFGGSTCKITLDAPEYDGVAGKQLVSVLAGTKPAYDAATGEPVRVDYVAQESKGDPRVGMIGGSYGGQIQYAVAEQDPRVDTLIPLITWNDLSYSLAPNNTDFGHGVTYRTPGVHKRLWTTFFFGIGIADGVQNASVDPARVVGCPNFDDRACEAKANLELLGYPDAATRHFARGASVTSYLEQIDVPVLLVQGQKDTLFNLQEAAATYQGLRRQGTETRMIWQSWGHSFGGTPAPGELDLAAESIRDTYLGRRFLRWMDHYVRGDDAAPVGKRFCYFRDWVPYDESPQAAGQAVSKAYACRNRYSGDNSGDALYFTGSDGLTTQKGSVQTGQATYTNLSAAPTSYSETSALEGVYVNAPPTDTPGTVAAFTSAPLAAPASIVGTPSLTLHLDAPVAEQSQSTDPAMQLVLFAKIYDVAPDGSVALHNRLISPVRVADTTLPVRIELPGVVQRIEAGHRIRVVIAASDTAYNGNFLAQPVTVTTSPNHPSVLRLPTTGGDLQCR